MKKREKQIKAYFEQKRDFYDELLEFIECTDDIEINFDIFHKHLISQDFSKNLEEFEHFLLLLLSIANNHYRTTYFFNNIFCILEDLKHEIKQAFSNAELFEMFLSNRIILLFLTEKRIITLEKEYIKYFYNLPYYCHFFYPEIRNMIEKNEANKIEEDLHFYINNNNNSDNDFYKKRLDGENDSYICSLIRSDSVEEFISYFNRKQFSLSQKIEPSIFETNSFLIDKKPTLIEYSVFYGSIQIFDFLILNNVELPPSLWLYSIHSNNGEIIHRLENNSVRPSDYSFEECLEEAIKCHHNDVAEYIKDRLLLQSNPEQSDQIERIISYGFKYYNYKYFPKQFKENYIFYYMSKYNYLKIVQKLVRNDKKKIKNIRKAAEKNKTCNVYYLLSKLNKIYDKCFYECRTLKEIAIPPSIKSIEKCSFYECKALVRVSIPKTVITIGSHAFCRCSSLIEIDIPTSVISIGKYSFDGCKKLKRITIPPKITKIEECCFYGCESLSHISLPSTIEIIDHHAFYGCLSLNNIKITSSIRSICQSSFKECSKLVEVIFENALFLETICKSSFQRCNSLKMITIPSSVASLGNFSFCGCSSLKQTVFATPSSLSSIGNFAFSQCFSLAQIIIPSSVISIGQCAFQKCSSLTQITIPSSVAAIGKYAFFECSLLTKILIVQFIDKRIELFEDKMLIYKSKLKSENYDVICWVSPDIKIINIPPFIKKIENYAFNGCSSLTQITIPPSVTSIGNYAFDGCSSLTQITIPSSVTSIGNYAFNGCSSLTQITIPSSVNLFGKYAFCGCISLELVYLSNSLSSIESSIFRMCENLRKIFIPLGVETIGNNAFRGCHSLTDVIIPQSVKKIGKRCFKGDFLIESITLPENLTIIEKSTFKGCFKLQNVNIPSKVAKIEKNAWEKCQYLKKLIIPHSVTEIQSNAFRDCSSLTHIYYDPSKTSIDEKAFFDCKNLHLLIITTSEPRVTIDMKPFPNVKKIMIPNNITSIDNPLPGIQIFTSANYLGDNGIKEILDVEELNMLEKGM